VTKPPVQLGAESLIPHIVRIGQLLDLYGRLLTEKQREFMKLHYADDLSFGEIAFEHNVSRQAIHDAVKHAEQTLEHYEEKLGFLAQGNPQPAIPKDSHAQDHQKMAETKQIIRNLKRMLQKKGIIYNVDWIIKDLDQVLRLLG
jgi:predicted DNA-binding protein YlxM (UPF0122 family)